MDNKNGYISLILGSLSTFWFLLAADAWAKNDGVQLWLARPVALIWGWFAPVMEFQTVAQGPAWFDLSQENMIYALLIYSALLSFIAFYFVASGIKGRESIGLYMFAFVLSLSPFLIFDVRLGLFVSLAVGLPLLVLKKRVDTHRSMSQKSWR